MGGFFVKGIISGNHNQPCIFSLSTQGRLFSPCPEGCVVIMLVSVCEWVGVCLCLVCMRVCVLRSCNTASRLLEGESGPWTEPDEEQAGPLRVSPSMCNTYTPGGNARETNRLITATLSRTRQFLWEDE